VHHHPSFRRRGARRLPVPPIVMTPAPPRSVPRATPRPQPWSWTDPDRQLRRHEIPVRIGIGGGIASVITVPSRHAAMPPQPHAVFSRPSVVCAAPSCDGAAGVIARARLTGAAVANMAAIAKPASRILRKQAFRKCHWHAQARGYVRAAVFYPNAARRPCSASRRSENSFSASAISSLVHTPQPR
jgi:hypothetical protein